MGKSFKIKACLKKASGRKREKKKKGRNPNYYQ